VEVIRQNRETKQIDAEAPGKLLEQVFDPDLTVVVILASYFIGSQQKSPPNDTIHHVNNGNIVWRKHFFSCQASHGQPPSNREKVKRTRK